jgi:protoporphyrinogen oxidase
MERYEFCVIGSGISGMSFAHHAAKKGGKVLVLEKKPYAGGCVRTLTHDHFWLELGGHTIYNSYKTFISTMRELGIEEKFLPREKAGFKMYKNNKVEPLMSSLSKAELMMNGFKLFFMSKKGKTVKEYYSSVLGNKNFETMFKPMISAVISQDASNFPADMLLKKRDRDKTAPRNFTLRGGMSEFIKAVAAEKNIDVRTGSEAVDVVKRHSGFMIETESGESYMADNVVMACPPPMASALLKNTCDDVSSILAGIKGAKVETTGIIVKKEDVNVDNFSFIIAADDDFTSAVSRDILPDDKYRGFAFHFKGDKLDEEGKLNKMEDVLGMDRGSIVAKEDVVHFSPTLGLNHETAIEALESAIAKHEGLYIVGNYFGGLAIEDCALRASEV